MSHKILTLPSIEKTIHLVKDCVTLNCLGAISGIPGTGKTVSLQAVESRYVSMGLPGICVYYRCCSNSGPTRGIKDILESLGVRSGLLPSVSTLQFTVKVAQREFATRQVRVLLLDEADSWDIPSLQGLITLYDTCLLSPHPVTFIFAGSVHLVKWLSKYNAALSRTLRCESLSNLTLPLTMSLLSQWGEPFEKLAFKVNQKNLEGLKTIKLIYQSTGGNLRRLTYFAKLAALEEKELSFEETKKILDRLHQEVA